MFFENLGSEVGATISHPHCKIYAYDHVPVRPRTMFANNWQPDPAPDRLVASNSTWTTFVPFAPVFPISITLAPMTRRANLLDLDDRERDDLADALVDTFHRLDRLYETPLPTMMWINQQPSNGDFDNAWMSIEIVSPWRARGLSRYVAAAEIGGGEFFVPVVPEEVAASLRNLDPATSHLNP
jgi:UDPglucose--hexose-1-phosphate uridylyltransferase